MTTTRSLLRAGLTAGAVAAIAVTSIASADGPGRGRPAALTISASPQPLQLYGLPCTPGDLTVGLTNDGDEALFADMTIEPDAPLLAWRERFTTYLPPGATNTGVLELRAPREALPGQYAVHLTADRTRLDVPVEVLTPPQKGPGDNLAFGEQAVASSTHGNFAVCGAVDGNTNSEDWDTLTGWNDATSGVFPDTYGVQLGAPASIDRVEIDTLNSTRYPAARYGVRDLDVQVMVAGQWQTVGSIRGNTAGHMTVTFPAVTAEAVQIVVLASNNRDYSRLVEVGVYGS
jgi:F5/8 type C domain-containing protein